MEVGLPTLPLPDSSSDISTEWLNEVLGDAGVTDGTAVQGFEREVIGEGYGFVGEITRLSLTYDRADAAGPRSRIAKLPTADEAIRSIALLFGWYEHEVRFYEEIAGQVEVRTPKCYYSAMDVPAGRFALLLEDLAPARCGDQLASCSLDDAKLALRELAKLHAAWWDSPRLEQLDWMPALDDRALQQVLVTLYQQSWPYFVEQVGQQVPKAVLDVGERFGANLSTMMEGLAERHNEASMNVRQAAAVGAFYMRPRAAAALQEVTAELLASNPNLGEALEAETRVVRTALETIQSEAKRDLGVK